MIASERETRTVTIRIHDDSYVPDPTPFLPQLDEIVSGSYQRRSRILSAPPHP